ncbi:MAG TPA: MT-A70 family methyltransferase, partial [Pseudolabrys sp.]|nr:MT-A70 family methyltransferase [Pseudolabrys sp.]
MSRNPSKAVALDAITISSHRMRNLRSDVVGQLAESIGRQGLLQPVLLRPFRNRYQLIAGRHRLEAVRTIGHTSISAVILSGLDADRAALAEIDENLVRAELSPAERALHVARRKQLYEREHPETKHGGKREKASRQSGDLKRFTKDAAAKIGRSERTIQREIARTKIVDLVDVVGTSLDEADELDKLAALPKPVQRDLIARAKSGERVTAKHVLKKISRENRERELAQATEAASRTLGSKRFAVLYADPPWRFEVHAETGMDRLADNHYPTMTTEAIKAVSVPAADDCVLFLWATAPMLPQAIEVMAAWGFTYKSLITWVKDRPGTGYWIRNRVELLLIGTRGNVPAPVPGEQPEQVIEAPRGRHSEKPEVFAEIIERLFPNA